MHILAALIRKVNLTLPEDKQELIVELCHAKRALRVILTKMFIILISLFSEFTLQYLKIN